jgi:hypothetical protein
MHANLPLARKFRIIASAFLLLALHGRSADAAFTEHSNTAYEGGQPFIDARSASLADIDNDGDLDVFFHAAGSSTSAGHRLYRNNFIGSGTLSFTNITGTGNFAGVGDAWSAAWGDYDGDGYVDVFVGQTNSGSAVGDVLKNNAGSSFTNTTTTVGLTDPGFHQNVAWNDIDGDLDLDLIIAMEGPDQKHEIYLQGESGTFTPVGAAAGFQVAVGVKAYGMAIGDTDSDGDLDIYISTCWDGGTIRNNFFKNLKVETGSLSFIDLADTNNTQYFPNSYGTEFHDYDNDSDLDLFVVGADGNQSKMFRNEGNNMFTDTDTITGHAMLSETGGDFNGARSVDYDNDGDLDLYFHDRQQANGDNFARKLYRNDGNWTFTDVTAAESLHETNRTAFDSTWGDLDRDGDQDLIAPSGGTSTYERLFLNDASANGNHWLYINLVGPTENTSAIGASVYATMNNGTEELLTLRRESNTNAGTFNQSDLPVHFGLGAETVIDQLRIQWPDGTMQYLFDVPADQYLTIAYDGSIAGDLNRDGTVDASDYVWWRKGAGDLYTEADHALWLKNLGRSTPGGGGAAPEPSAGILLLALMVFWPARRGRQISQC